ncbi:MAG TPA: 50S ribosomal protein L13 [Candidatus Aenigmarchaeota archaeon]|nr:50S ribosomal protein L13 [Candidatus Aenigmarchaeota archaeon]
MHEKYIDARDCILGRLASIIAKRLLNGEKINVVNAEHVVISGNPKAVFEIFKEKVERGDPYHGPFYPRYPDKIFKRVVRGMLPYKKPRGREALKRLKVYISVPENLKEKEFEIIEAAKNRLEHKYTTLGKVAEKIGAKKVW